MDKHTNVVEQPDMGITHADFLRIFPRVVNDSAISSVSEGLQPRVLWRDGRSLQVLVSEQKIRRISLLRIPYVDVRFEFTGFSEHQTEQFLRRFMQAFQKGGG